MRQVFIRERIQIVHTHQATSSLGHEALLCAKAMGLKTVYTDHSLFGFADAACIHINKVLKMILTYLDAAISVSYTNKENLTLRAMLSPYMIHVIPNAVDCSKFVPNPGMRRPLNTINVVVMSRLTYRKGVDMLLNIIPPLCHKFPEV